MATMDDERVARLEAIEQLRGLACDMQRGAASFWEVARWPPLMTGMSDSAREAFLARKLSQAADAYARARAVVYALQELERLERAYAEGAALLDRFGASRSIQRFGTGISDSLAGAGLILGRWRLGVPKG